MKNINEMINGNPKSTNLSQLVLADTDVKRFLAENNLTEEDISHSIVDLFTYITNKDKYNITWSGDVELVLNAQPINPGIIYTGDYIFADDYLFSEIKATSESKISALKMATKLSNNNQGFYLHGSNGIGKTYFVIALANQYYQQTNIKTTYVQWVEFVKTMRQFNNKPEQLFNRVKLAKRLIIDDLGTEKISDFNRDEILAPLILFRLERGLETHITSNYTIDELEGLYTLRPNESKKVRSLMTKLTTLSTPIEIIGEDVRNR